jgi:hypothetical protein
VTWKLHRLHFALLLLAAACSLGCATTPKAGVSELCANGRATATVVANFAIYQGVPKGIAVNRVWTSQLDYNKTVDQVIGRFFEIIANAEDGEVIQVKELEAGRIRFVRVGGHPLTFAVCRESTCTGRHDPFSHQPVAAFERDPFTLSALAARSGLHKLMTDNWFEKSERELIHDGTTVDSTVKGEWLIRQIILNPEKLCRYAHPKTDLVSH